jgi:hypothetical protein
LRNAGTTINICDLPLKFSAIEIAVHVLTDDQTKCLEKLGPLNTLKWLIHYGKINHNPTIHKGCQNVLDIITNKKTVSSNNFTPRGRGRGNFRGRGRGQSFDSNRGQSFDNNNRFNDHSENEQTRFRNNKQGFNDNGNDHTYY